MHVNQVLHSGCRNMFSSFLSFSLSWVLLLKIVEVNSVETKLHPLLHNHRHGNGIKQSLIEMVRPEQIHISFGEKINDMVIIWASKKKIDEPYIEYGRDANLRKATAEATQFEEANKEGTKYWHRAYLSDLKDGEQYFYRVNSGRGAGGVSEQLSFTVPSLKRNSIHSVMILADMGISSKTLDFLVQEALNGGYEAVIHIGDIANDLHRGGGMVGDKYLKRIQKMAAQVPYMTCPGDQEEFQHYVHYRYRFSMPGSSWPMSYEKLWYSYNLGSAHFIVINTEVLCAENHELKEAQLSWLKNDLSINNKEQRPKHPWFIMFGHKPMYASCNKEEEECLKEQPALRKELDDILFRYGVDLYIAGHQHNYERTWPVYREKLFDEYHYKNPKGPIHLTIGSMGAEYHQEKFVKPGGKWSSFRYPGIEKELFAKLDIINATHLFWEVLSASNNEKVDRIWIVQNSHGTFGEPGEGVFQRIKELRNIPMQPPIPPEDHSRYMAKLTRKKLRSRKTRQYGVQFSVIITCAVAVIIGLMSWRMRKNIWMLFRIGTGGK
ncbi:acid phosphatase type 7-like [Haliotis asinina]|uniref:acid phosphatase type 7-like n=1 Tax=Haliotis asinina TaxID=109174 RepID=UPI00353211B6